MPYSGLAMKSSHAPAAVPQTSTGFKGDPCILPYGDVCDEEPYYDFTTQFEFSADGDYSDIISNNAKELVETCYFDAEVEDCTYDDEMVYCYDAEVEDYNYDAVDYFEL